MLIIFNVLTLTILTLLFNNSASSFNGKEIFAMNYQIKYKNYLLNQTAFSCQNNTLELKEKGEEYSIITNRKEIKQTCNLDVGIIKIKDKNEK